MKTKQEMIDEVMDNFDFERVHKMMAAVDWKWVNDEGGYSVPDVAELRKTARRLMRKAIDERLSGYGTGGFNVERGKDYLHLSWGVEYTAERDDEL